MICLRLALASLAVLSLFPSTAVASAPDSCKKTYTRGMFHSAARSSLSTVPARRVRTVRKTIRCQRGGKRSRRIVRRHWARYRRAYHRRRAVNAVTPYNCGVHGRFAIPCGIIACESGFSWTAYNPSGARGPYQFLGWPVPWPVRTVADKLAHHRMGAKLWAGGSGASHWVCKG